MSNSRQYSKLKAIGGHVVWTEREVLQVPLYLEGSVFDQVEFAVIKIAGRDVLLHGARADVRVQTASNNVDTTFDLYTGENVLVPDTTMTLVGTAPNTEKTFSPNIVMPAGSYWKVRVGFNDSFEAFAAQGITFTYQYSYANGPVQNPLAAFQLLNDGIGFWTIGDDFIVS